MGFKLIKNIVVIFFAIGIALWLNQPNATNSASKNKNYSSFIAFADENPEMLVTDMVIGNENAKIDIVEYASYTCSHCATFHTNVYPKLKQDYIETGKVRFTYREVYFDKYGLWASMIARCAGPEKFFGLTDLIYKSQDKWARAG